MALGIAGAKKMPTPRACRPNGRFWIQPSFFCIGLIALRTLNSFLHFFQVGSAGNSVGATCVANSLNSRHGFEMCLFPR
jgi:hypothetical protein